MPVIELVTTVAPGVGGSPTTLPEMLLPDCVNERPPDQSPVTLIAPGVGGAVVVVVDATEVVVVVVATDVVDDGMVVVVPGIVVVATVVVVVLVVVVGFGGGGVSGLPTEMPPMAPPKSTPVVPSIRMVPTSLTARSPESRTGESGAVAVHVPFPVNVPFAVMIRPFKLWAQPE